MNFVYSFIFLFFSLSAFANESATDEITPNEASSLSVLKPESDINKVKLSYYVIQENRDLRFNVGVYWTMSQFSLDGRSLQGAGPEVMMGYALNEKLSVNFGISQALDTANGLSALYSGIRTAMAWTLIGSAFAKKIVVNVNGEPTYAVTRTQESMLATEVGLEQVFFNGSSNVSPATGYSLGVRYDFPIWKVRLSTIARFGNLKISSDPITLTVLGAGLLYRF